MNVSGLQARRKACICIRCTTFVEFNLTVVKMMTKSLCLKQSVVISSHAIKITESSHPVDLSVNTTQQDPVKEHHDDAHLEQDTFKEYLRTMRRLSAQMQNTSGSKEYLSESQSYVDFILPLDTLFDTLTIAIQVIPFHDCSVSNQIQPTSHSEENHTLASNNSQIQKNVLKSAQMRHILQIVLQDLFLIFLRMVPVVPNFLQFQRIGQLLSTLPACISENDMIDWVSTDADISAAKPASTARIESSQTTHAKPLFLSSHLVTLTFLSRAILENESDIIAQQLVMSSILSESEPKTRAKTIAKFMYLSAGINSSSISRLKYTRQYVADQPGVSQFAALERLMSSEKSSANYRAALKHSCLPCIPYLPYDISPNLQITNMIANFPKMGEEEAFRRSPSLSLRE
ncbi:hypothetical protein BSLG_005664 [Batrachochytrium salamandrivorans]|nr:hypothetical protein BSLG_005664 [Batrachochytrium salamandrivorans]